MPTILTNSGVRLLRSCSLLSSLASWAPASSHMVSVNSASSSSFVSKINFSKNVSGTLGRAYNTFTSRSTGSLTACTSLAPASLHLSVFSLLSIVFLIHLSGERNIHPVCEKWQNYHMLFCRVFSPARVYQGVFPNKDGSILGVILVPDIKIMITFTSLLLNTHPNDNTVTIIWIYLLLPFF